ncbi:efflux RND transporter permease subunit [Sneathiella glossodoripedis]|uniref:efflux RND transporter permease subunit n=1 Tax=Sneathiella glossodoripedis TaxID=418853 RepID=UPI00046FC645|nr:multidrug efflux RND transporter permease subunit [Sneathiella glossodoripedis]
MNIAGYFINRPIMASVLSILIFLSGLIALTRLPVSEYPEVSPPSIVVNARFPGANPAVVAETVATPLEEQINGVENMLYLNSLASSDGTLQLRVTFAIGTDPDLAQQLVQNRVSQALPRLPAVTRNLGVTVTKSSPDLTMVVHLRSPNNSYDMLYLRNYATLNVKDELAKIQGVGEVGLFGSGDYAMRIWLNPNLAAERNLTAREIVEAIRRQNVQVAAGVVGGPPYDTGVQVQMPLNVQGRLSNPEEFANIIVKRDENGTITRLSDIARIELDAQTYSLRSLLNNQQAVAIPIFASPGANALDISSNVRQTMAELKENMPADVDYSIVYDPTVFVSDSIKAVIKTLLEAVALVVLVVIIFLQTWRASIIPLLAVPVSIVGTFAFMYLFGFSINVLSLFGLILAIGIVVDDAIVVVENVERNVEEGKTPREATIQAMKEVTGPIIATSLVLVGVFVPIAFVSGLTGQFYLQFALTIAIATVISTINSLTLSPAMAAILLKPKHEQKDWLTRLVNLIMGRFFSLFNRGFNRSQNGYAGSVKIFASRKFMMMLVFGGLLALTGHIFNLVPKGFVPAQDKGYLISFAQLPPGATLERTENVIRKMASIAVKQEGVSDAVQFPGLSINGFVDSPASGIVFVPLDDFSERTEPHLNGFAIAQQLQQKYAAIDEAFIAIFPAPPVSGLGNTGGFKLQIQDRTDQGYEALATAVQKVLQKAQSSPELMSVYSNYNISYPQLFANIDRTKAEQLGVSVDEIFTALQTYLGSMYVNDFNRFGRTYQVVAQADKEFRAEPSDIGNLQVRNLNGQMIPLGTMLSVEETFGPEIASRYNAFRAADINGDAAPGYSSVQAQEAITKILKENLPPGIDFSWTELTYQQILAGNTAIYIFPLCLLLVFLVLAAQYESLTLPLAIISIVPMAILSALLGIYLSGGDNNIFTQISLFVLAGLASKNAILIVEFAKELEKNGKTIVAAAVEASRLRLRPILMTSIAFIMGVLPLVLSQGAGAEMRQAIGIAVFYGMIGVTFFGLIFTPVFYVLFRTLEAKLSTKAV